MNADTNRDKHVRLLNKGEKIPYDLLLLADETKEAIDKYINDSEIYVLEEHNVVIAVYVLKVIDQDLVEIKNIAVDESHQRMGLGKFLLKDASGKAVAKRFKAIVIGTGDVSTDLLFFYQKEGFEMSEIRKNFFLDNYSRPLYENGLQLRHMVVLKKELVHRG